MVLRRIIEPSWRPTSVVNLFGQTDFGPFCLVIFGAPLPMEGAGGSSNRAALLWFLTHCRTKDHVQCAAWTI